MSAVNVVVLPGKYQTRDLTSVSFLGPILEETALDIMLMNKPIAITTKYRHALKYTHSIMERRVLSLNRQKTDEAKIHSAAGTEDRISRSLGMPFSPVKEVPNIAAKNTMQHVPLKPSGRFSGALAEREVIYMPIRPELPSWVDASSRYVLELELSVSSQGEVNEVVPAVSTGNSEVDLLGIRYVKGWKFAPRARESKEDQTGRIKLIFGARLRPEAL